MRRALVALVLVLMALPAAAEEIGSVGYRFKWLGPNDKIVVEAFDDPEVPGVTCYMSHARTGGIKGAIGLAEDPGEASIACRQVGPISFAKPLPVQEEIFNERLSILFDLTVPLDRSLPYAKREWVAYSHLNGAMPGNLPGSMRFIEKIRLHREKPPRYDLLITPGANAINRLWPLSHYVSLVHMIPRNYRIAVAGLPDDIAKMQRALPKDRQIQFLAGTLEEAICAIAQSRAVLTMDSGSMHFASALNVPGITLFGKDDPASVISTGESILPIYERKFPCQPCRSVHCSQPEVYCMNSILPETVAKALIHLLQSSATDVAVTA